MCSIEARLETVVAMASVDKRLMSAVGAVLLHQMEPSRIDQIWLPSLHSSFPVSLTRVQGPTDPSPLLVLAEVKDALLGSLVSDSTFQRHKQSIDGLGLYTRKSISPEERRVLSVLGILPPKSTTNVTLGKPSSPSS